MSNVAVFVGSLRKESINRKLAENMIAVGSDLLSFKMVPVHDIPMYNQDDDANVPAPVMRLKETIAASDGILFVTPEYNRTIPPLTKNLVDWGSRPWGQNTWSGKPSAIAGISPSPVGTAIAQSHLRSVLTILNVPLLSYPELYITETPGFFDDKGIIASEKTREFLRGFLVKFADFIKLHAKK